MPIAHLRKVSPSSSGIAIVVVLVASLAYAVVTMQLVRWALSIAVLTAVVLATVVLVLLYRLVLAVERIADDR